VPVRVAVLGSGSWGTTLGCLLAEQGVACTLWGHRPRDIEEIERRRENVRFLPGVALPDQLRLTADSATALRGVDVVVLAVPMRSLLDNLRAVRPDIPSGATLVSGIKGLDPVTGARVSETLAAQLGVTAAERFCVISGPNLARELAAHEPATTVVASHRADLAQAMQRLFTTPWLRVYTSDDVAGVELAGAIKNVIAICAGMVDGLRYGFNTRAAVMTRGLAEITRLGLAAGANPLTFAGLAGVGDLIATCSSAQSRNHYVGEQLAQGRTLDEIRAHMVMVAEGIDTARGALALARRCGVEMPIVELMNEVLFHELSVADATRRLMDREPVHELRGFARG